MKKLLTLSLLVFTLIAQAQNKVTKEVKKDANAVGNKTAEVASKTASAVVDQKYKDKEGPNGEIIYIDKHDKYYYVDKKGHHKYVKVTQLKDKQQ